MISRRAKFEKVTEQGGWVATEPGIFPEEVRVPPVSSRPCRVGRVCVVCKSANDAIGHGEGRSPVSEPAVEGR